jgi:hypothetical protein
MSATWVEFRGELVVFLVERAAGDEDLDAIGFHPQGGA